MGAAPRLGAAGWSCCGASRTRRPTGRMWTWSGGRMRPGCGPPWRRSTSETARRCCCGPRGSTTRRSPPRWAWPRERSARRWPGRADAWSKPIGRRSGVGPRTEGRMSHLDEGTLHALLDGELETHEVAEIQAHLGSCSSCGLRLREVKEFYAEADRLIASVDLQATAATAVPRPTPAPSAAAPARAEAPARRDTPRPQPAAAAPAWEPWNDPPPVLLVPDNESGSERRMKRMRQVGWAAILLVIVGAGFVEARKFMPTAPADTPPASNANTVLSQEESPSRDAPMAAAAPLAKTDTPAAPTR